MLRDPACIAIVDAAHARLYTYKHIDEEPRLLEARDLVNPGRQAHDKFADTKPGNRWQEGGRGSTDDHRDDYIAECDARFAKHVVQEVEGLVIGGRLGRRVILVAAPKMLGALRTAAWQLRRHELAIHELAEDLAWMTTPQLHEHLARHRLIAARQGAIPRAT
ncbi:MAG: Host attachment protein [Myxococcales bacterium]|nr:Host attachment protein [Myxococcales bacterium]